jgi:signal transduction histidine kinase
VDAVEPLPEKCLEVKVNNVGTDVAISVMDGGKGIPKQLRDKVGQPFFTAKHAAHGTGLGLSISKGIVVAHGWHLNLDAECEHTRFVVTLPKAVELQRVAAEVGK